MGRLTQRRGVRQFLKFAVVGASGFVVNLAIGAVIVTFIWVMNR